MSLENEIINFTEIIWNNTLNLAVKQTDSPFKPGDDQTTLAGCVHISGEWQGTVAIHCPKSLAQKAAAIMFSQTEENCTFEDIQDALGELANMMGGNIKSLLPDPSILSLPVVAITNHDLRFPKTEPVAMLTFECENNPFMVTIVKKAEEIP